MKSQALVTLALATLPLAAQTALHRIDPALDKLLAPDAKVEKVAGGFQFVEGPVWNRSGGYLLFSDIPANTIMKWSPKGGATVFRDHIYPDSYPPGMQVGTNGLTLDKQGRIIACEHGNRRVSRIAKDGTLTVLADRYEGKRLNSPNDVVVKSNGDIYFTDPPFGLLRPGETLAQAAHNPRRELSFNGVYRITPDKKLYAVIKDLDLPNGLAFSPDERKLYVANSADNKWYVYDVNRDGTMSNEHVFFDGNQVKGEGLPDGMKVDREGNIWAAGPGGIVVISPQAKLLGVIAFPEVPANCAWGDADGKTLYVTARTALYRIRTKVTGIRP
ncbi:MAG TPA: SMP-30/gluconolactonase/LRE family protein [Bryobacteraceae bacterium]|nr:SMP-30/gluconolactonase/LRE family protein [Bryobacteraceae bacterium]